MDFLMYSEANWKAVPKIKIMDEVSGRTFLLCLSNHAFKGIMLLALGSLLQWKRKRNLLVMVLALLDLSGSSFAFLSILIS